ncbi:hypothetical protein COO60DRAFT_1640213 [Scenedesmus sp. NREL 46B-D3]|nr:hypothetical protein COO60DRAFT_1640213 [Scenedesmus sp. NREL 46B-D3]
MDAVIDDFLADKADAARKRSRWKTQQLVVTKAKQLAEQLGVADEEFGDDAAAAAPPTAAEQRLQQQVEEEPQQLSTVALVQQAAEDQGAAAAAAAAAAEQQLDSDVKFRLRGSLLFIARYTLEQVLLPDKPLLVPGCTADEAIAAVVAANAALPQPHPVCIKSDDSDFWQLEWHGRHSSRSSCSTCSAMEQQQQQADADASEDDERQDSQSDHDQQQQDTEISDDLDRDRHQQQQQQWLFQCGIKWALCCSADTMPRHHLHKCALLGKGREDLLQCGTAFGAVPAGLTLEDAAGTPVQGQARPGDAAYLRQCAAFDDAVRGEAAWSLQLPELLAWLHQFRHQSPAIRARFLVKMVQHSIDPFCRWSAMPAELQDICSRAAADVLEAVPENATTSSSGKLKSQQQGGANDAAAAGSSPAAPTGTSSNSGSSSSSRKKKSGGNKKKKQKRNHRHR